MNMRYNTMATGRVDRSGDKKVISINPTQFSMDDLRVVVHELTESGREKLAKLMFMRGAHQLPQIPMQKIHDKPGEGQKDWSFGEEAENGDVFDKAGFGQDGSRWGRSLSCFCGQCSHS